MKLQLRIFKNVFNFNIIKISLLYYISLFVYYLLVVFNNYRTIEDFNAIFGIFSNYIFFIALLLFNISYFIVIIYKFLNYESKDLAVNIATRINITKWYLNKLLIIILFILITKIMQYFLFLGLNQIFQLNYCDINFFLNNLALFLLIGLIFFNINMFYYNISYLIILGSVFLIPNIYIILLLIIILSFFAGIKIFNYKKLLKLAEFK